MAESGTVMRNASLGQCKGCCPTLSPSVATVLLSLLMAATGVGRPHWQQQQSCCCSMKKIGVKL